jgi:hypothetical protein
VRPCHLDAGGRPQAVGRRPQRQAGLKISAAFLEQPVIETIDRDLALAGAEGKSPSAGPNLLSKLCVAPPIDA